MRHKVKIANMAETEVVPMPREREDEGNTSTGDKGGKFESGVVDLGTQEAGDENATDQRGEDEQVVFTKKTYAKKYANEGGAGGDDANIVESDQAAGEEKDLGARAHISAEEEVDEKEQEEKTLTEKRLPSFVKTDPGDLETEYSSDVEDKPWEQTVSSSVGADLFQFQKLQELLSSLLNHQQKQDRELKRLRKATANRLSLQNAEELRENILEAFEERLGRATEVRVQTETALKNDLEKRMSTLANDLGERMKVLEKNVETIQDELQNMQIALESKASKGDLLELEGRVDECAHIDIVDDLRDALGSKPSGEAFMALEEEVKLKAGKTDIQRLIANTEGKAERTTRQLREEMKALASKDEAEKLEERIKEMLSSIDGDAASNFEQISEQHSQTEEMLEQIRVALDERATLTELGQLEDAMNLLAGRDDLARVSAETSSKIKALQIKMDKSALDMRNIFGTLEVVEKVGRLAKGPLIEVVATHTQIVSC